MINRTSERLRRNTDRIIKRWEERARKEIAATAHLESLALRDSLPEYLRQLADALSTTIKRTDARAKSDRRESERVGKQHGIERAASRNYTLDQLILEYHILRQAICDVLEEEEILAPAEREVIVASIEQAVNDAATQFSETLREIQERLTHTLAHDLRSPITAAKSGAQLILRRPDDADHCIKLAGRISSNMDRLDSMIHDLLDASRIRAGESLPLKLQECDLDLIARQVADEANYYYGNRFIVVSTRPCLGNWNEDGIRRLIENLTTNAVKYGAPDTPVTIRVMDEKSTAVLSVHNQGAPIPREEQAILFQQFRRAKRTERKTGWGLGLTLVKGMAEAHGGTVSVESREGYGTKFTVELPKNIQALRMIK